MRKTKVEVIQKILFAIPLFGAATVNWVYPFDMQLFMVGWFTALLSAFSSLSLQLYFKVEQKNK